MKAIAAAGLILSVIGLAALLYVQGAGSAEERAARMRGCLLCHGDAFAEQPLSCLSTWQHGTPLSPQVEQCLLQAHPRLAGDDAPLLARYITTQQLPLLAQKRSGDRGAALYAAKCATCHGRNGEGQAGMYPPLRGSEWLTPSPQRTPLRTIIREGIQGPITVKGEPWNATMLPPGISAEADVDALIRHVETFR